MSTEYCLLLHLMSHSFHIAKRHPFSSIHNNCLYCTHPAKNIVIAHNYLNTKISAFKRHFFVSSDT